MSDPFSIAAGAAGIVSLGIEVTQSLVKYYKSYAGQDENVASTLRRLESLLNVMKLLGEEVSRRANDSLIQTVEDCSLQCVEAIEELKEELDRVTSSSTKGFRSNVKAVGKRVAYPFRKETLNRIEEEVNEIQINLSTALDVLHVRDANSALEVMTNVKESFNQVREYQVKDEVKKWLDPPDAYTNHNRSLSQHHPKTSLWFLEGDRFTRWLNNEIFFLWVQGFAGRGKTVLCSTAIDKTIRLREQKPGTGVAFYYFSFQEASKQDVQGLLRALSFQLAMQMKEGDSVLQEFKGCRGNQLSLPDLCDLLQRLVEKFTEVYFLWDAVDEIPIGNVRDQFFEVVDVMRSWPHLHILITSRDLEDIRLNLNPSDSEEISMKSDGQNDDIKRYIASRLATDPKLQRWRNFHDMIGNTLAEKASGVFRWVDCQLQFIARLPRSEARLQRSLASLPADLEKTYERMLCSIDADSAVDAKKLLSILSFSRSGLPYQHVLDALAIDLERSEELKVLNRLQGAEDLHLLCPGLVETDRNGYTHIAHFSVREYITSSQIKESKACYFALDPNAANFLLARICFLYLRNPKVFTRFDSGQPSYCQGFACYVPNHWFYHYSKAPSYQDELNEILLRTIDLNEEAIKRLESAVGLNELKILELSKSERSDRIALDSDFFTIFKVVSDPAEDPTIHPIGCLLRVLYINHRDVIFKKVLNCRLPENFFENFSENFSENISENLPVEYFAVALSNRRTLLYHMVNTGFKDYTRKLLDMGADPNVPGVAHELDIIDCENIDMTEAIFPLHLAVQRNDLEMVHLLLEFGADVNAVREEVSISLEKEEPWRHKTALDQAIDNSQERIEELLSRAGGLRYEDLQLKNFIY